jgi:hypothetical protein
MAAGDITLFAQFKLDVGNKVHSLNAADTIKLGIITSAVTPTATTADPRWGAGGTTNFATNQVTPATSYVDGGPTVATTWTLVSNVPTLRASGGTLTIAQDAGGFTNGRWGILYNDTAAGNQCIGFVDFGGDKTIVSGPLEINWNGATDDIATL